MSDEEVFDKYLIEKRSLRCTSCKKEFRLCLGAFLIYYVTLDKKIYCQFCHTWFDIVEGLFYKGDVKVSKQKIDTSLCSAPCVRSVQYLFCKKCIFE